MKVSSLTLVHDCGMLLAVCILQVWPSTGVPLHELLGLALASAVVVHLVMQWPWIAAHVRRFVAGLTLRARLNVLLNACLFVCMTTAMVSGIMVSKYVVPNPDQSPHDYLKW